MKSFTENKENGFLPYYIPFPALKIWVNILGKFCLVFFSINFLKIEDTWVRLKIQTIRGLSKKLSLLPQLLLSRVTTIVSYLWEAIIFFYLHEKTHFSMKAGSHYATQVKELRDFLHHTNED